MNGDHGADPDLIWRAAAVIIGGVTGIVTIASIYLRLVVANQGLMLESKIHEWVGKSFIHRESWEHWKLELERRLKKCDD